jgi:hypothetical protein
MLAVAGTPIQLVLADLWQQVAQAL